MTHIERHELTDAQVWNLMQAGCNALEIALWAGTGMVAVGAMMRRAARVFADARVAA